MELTTQRVRTGRKYKLKSFRFTLWIKKWWTVRFFSKFFIRVPSTSVPRTSDHEQRWGCVWQKSHCKIAFFQKFLSVSKEVQIWDWEDCWLHRTSIVIIFREVTNVSTFLVHRFLTAGLCIECRKRCVVYEHGREKFIAVFHV